LKPEHVQLLRELATADVGMTMEALVEQLQARCGVKVSSMTVRKTLAAQGIKRVKPERHAVPAERGKPARYGYTEAHRREAEGSSYSCALTEAEWTLVGDLFEREPHTRGAPGKFERKALVDACCYVLRTGCAWRLLPRDFPPWTTVYKAFVRWADLGVFETMHDRLREQWRQRLGRHHGPTAAVLDSQSNRSSPQGGEAGFDAGKKVKGRKRHIVVDTLGVVLAVTVTAASVQDRDGAPAVVAQACDAHPTLQKLWVDSSYAGECAKQLHAAHGIDVDVVRRPGRRNAYVFTTRPLQRRRHLLCPQASLSCHSVGSLNVPTPGTNAGGAWSCITIGAWTSAARGCGWRTPAGSRRASHVPFDLFNTL
jgi:putative transposase